MNATSAWYLNVTAKLNDPNLGHIYEQKTGEFRCKAFLIDYSCWLVIPRPGNSRIAFRMSYSPNDRIALKKISIMGEYEAVVTLPTEKSPVIRLTTTLKTVAPLLFPYWPRDIVFLGSKVNCASVEGEIKNLTALAPYNQDTETSAGDVAGGEWPEIGFALPPTLKNKPLQANKQYVLSDAFIAFCDDLPTNEPIMVRQYLDMLALVYQAIPKPDTSYKHWPDILQKGLNDLNESAGCWSQLAVLLPLLDYVEWSGAQLAVIQDIRQGLPAFYSEKYGTVMRWHPAVADSMDGDEEQKKPLVMDSWYLHHPLLNLSRLALAGDKLSEKLFLDSLEFAIKVAKHFNYNWPVFYKIDTLEVIKAETRPGMGGEKDVPGLYAHLMLQAWELTGKKRFLAEAKRAALKLKGLWDCNYGYGKNFTSFFALFPLNDAPYTAVYEEQEVFCAFHDYLRNAEGEDILPSLRLLIAEYIRFLVERAAYYYPTLLPAEMLSGEAKVGEVDASLWIALEDLHDGWEKSGAVGQEVYGAGNAFGILPRHYMQVPKAGMMIFTDYPIYGFSANKHLPAKFRMAGDGRIDVRLMLVNIGKGQLKEFTVTVKGMKEPLKGKKTKDGHLEFSVPGDSEIHIAKTGDR
eukprot:gene7475-7539_t